MLSMTIPAITDNQGNSAILAKMFTTSWPGAAILAEIAATLMHHDCECDIEFRGRDSNNWSDDLANMRLEDFSENNRVEFDFHDPCTFQLLPQLVELGCEYFLAPSGR